MTDQRVKVFPDNPVKQLLWDLYHESAQFRPLGNWWDWMEPHARRALEINGFSQSQAATIAEQAREIERLNRMLCAPPAGHNSQCPDCGEAIDGATGNASKWPMLVSYFPTEAPVYRHRGCVHKRLWGAQAIATDRVVSSPRGQIDRDSRALAQSQAATIAELRAEVERLERLCDDANHELAVMVGAYEQSESALASTTEQLARAEALIRRAISENSDFVVRHEAYQRYIAAGYSHAQAEWLADCDATRRL